MSSVVIAGNTSGTITLDAPNVAGTTVLTLPTTSGTVVTDATSTGINASALSTGTVPTARLASGTADNTTYLRGDQTWATVSSSPTTNQVLSATAGATAGEVGTYAWLQSNSNGAIRNQSANTNIAGSNLFMSSLRSTDGNFNGPAANNGNSASSTLSGTWKLMGADWANQANINASLFLRVA